MAHWIVWVIQVEQAGHSRQAIQRVGQPRRQLRWEECRARRCDVTVASEQGMAGQRSAATPTLCCAHGLHTGASLSAGKFRRTPTPSTFIPRQTCMSGADAALPSPVPCAWLTPRSAKKQPRGEPSRMSWSTLHRQGKISHGGQECQYTPWHGAAQSRPGYATTLTGAGLSVFSNCYKKHT